ncbi:MAG: hypothetical protein NTW67_06640 [Candidatus Woesearchaeota archaeon]|nr:hypothetical protein [Candidatus Woesearchaeota archaeon]
MVNENSLLWKHFHYTFNKDCRFRNRFNKHVFAVSKGGWIICQDCGWRDPKDF